MRPLTLRARARVLAIVTSLSLLAPTISFVAISVAPRTALAQPKKKPIRDQLPPDAQKQWDTALDLYKHGDWVGARTSFNAAYDASAGADGKKNPRVLFNVAVCEKNQSHYGRAIDIYKRELSEGASVLDADERKEIQAQIDGLSKFVAQVIIEVNEPGADVYVDDLKVGTSPLAEPVSVALGLRRVRASKPGFADANDTVDLQGGASGRVALRLGANVKTGIVNVTVIGAASADVLVDGRVVGTAPYKGQVNVSAEPHEFAARATGYVGEPQHAFVKEGDIVNVTIALSREQDMGKLSVSAIEGATILIDGKTVGATRWDGPVEAKTHQVVVKKTGYYPWSYDVDVPRGGERTVTASMNEDRNTSFVPWLIGTVLIVGAGTTALVLMLQPKDQQKVDGTLPPFSVPTQGLRWH